MWGAPHRKARWGRWGRKQLGSRWGVETESSLVRGGGIRGSPGAAPSICGSPGAAPSSPPIY
eukprot:350874-Chlamydomonas_euryale.AAC.2